MDHYTAEKNKPFIFHLVLGVWVGLVMSITVTLPLTANGKSYTAFYVPLLFYPPLLFFVTRWLFSCANHAFRIIGVTRDNPLDFREPCDEGFSSFNEKESDDK